MGSYSLAFNSSLSMSVALNKTLAAQQKGNPLWQRKEKTKSHSESQFKALSSANLSFSSDKEDNPRLS